MHVLGQVAVDALPVADIIIITGTSSVLAQYELKTVLVQY